jgi:mRNA interferase RelE/StbE
MKKWKTRFTPEASRLLSKLHPENKRRIKKALGGLQQDPYPGKDLQEELSGFKSLRIKRYRVVYNINEEEKIIQILYIGLRSDVYEQFRYLLTELNNFSSTIK